jgi:hypothetical protein
MFEPLPVGVFQMDVRRSMGTVQKLLLALAVMGLVIGIPVTFSHTAPAPALALALPLGVVFWGLFLMSKVWRKEMASFDEDERLRMEAVRRHRSTASGGGHQGAEESTHALTRCSDSMQPT